MEGEKLAIVAVLRCAHHLRYIPLPKFIREACVALSAERRSMPGIRISYVRILAVLLPILPVLSAQATPCAIEPDMAAEAAQNPGSVQNEQWGAREKPEDTIPVLWLRSGQDRLGATAWSWVETIDGWFGDRPFAESGGRVSGGVRISGQQLGTEAFSTVTRFQINARMPNVDERILLFAGREDPEKLVQDRQEDTVAEGETRQQEILSEEADFFAGLGVRFRENVELRLGVRGGYKPYTQLRLRANVFVGERQYWQVTETIFFSVDSGAGSTTVLAHSYRWEPGRTYRTRVSGTISTQRVGADWNGASGWLWEPEGKRQWKLESVWRGNTSAPVPVRQYGMQGVGRVPIIEDWMIFEGIVGRMFTRYDTASQRRGEWLVGVGIEMLF